MQQVVLTGASNLALSLPVALNLLRTRLDQPLEILAARGHGRSYGGWSRFLYFRQLPGIIDCGLWQKVAQSPPAEPGPLAVITDIGNDLLYGYSVATISGWVKTCIERLQSRQATVVLTTLPMAGIEQLSARNYYLLRTMLFPACRISWDSMRSRAITLNGELEKLAGRTGVRLVTPEPQWYGLDPLHIRRNQHHNAWQKIIQAAGLPRELPTESAQEFPAMQSQAKVESSEPAIAAVSLPARLRLMALKPAERRLFGRLQSHQQPAAHWSDGSSLWLY